MKRAMVFRWILVLSVVALFACSGKEEAAPRPKPKPVREAPRPAVAPVAEPPAAQPPEPKQPEPQTPEEIELARKAALMEGRDKDAYKYCVMAGIKAGESDEQALLGCALAACRIKEVDQAREWASSLSKPLMKQAKKICKANGVGL